MTGVGRVCGVSASRAPSATTIDTSSSCRIVDQLVAEPAPAHVRLDAADQDDVALAARRPGHRDAGRRPLDAAADARRPATPSAGSPGSRSSPRGPARPAASRPRSAPGARRPPWRRPRRRSSPRTRPPPWGRSARAGRRRWTWVDHLCEPTSIHRRRPRLHDPSVWATPRGAVEPIDRPARLLLFGVCPARPAPGRHGSADRAARAAHPRARRRDGHDDPAAPAGRGRATAASGSPTGRATCRATTTCSAHPARRSIAAHPPRVPRGRRRPDRDQHLQRARDLAGRLRHGGARLRAQPRLGPAGPRRRATR